MPGVFMLVVGAADASLALQGSAVPDGVVQLLTALGFFAVGGWAIKDHLALRKEKAADGDARAKADKVLAEELQAIRDDLNDKHEANTRRFDAIDRNIKGDEAYPGLLSGDRRNRDRRHFLMNQLAAFVNLYIEDHRQLVRLSAQAQLPYDDQAVLDDLREIIRRLRGDEEQPR